MPRTQEFVIRTKRPGWYALFKKILHFFTLIFPALFKTVAGIIHLGDVDFNIVGEKQCTIKSKVALENAATLLDVPKKFLSKALLHRTLRMKGQSDVEVGLSLKEVEINFFFYPIFSRVRFSRV